MAKIAKPRGVIIRKKRAIEICSHWHGGQWSALYSFCSTGRYIDKKYSDYLSEIKENNPQKVKEKAELNSLKRFFDYKHWEANK